MALLWMVAVIGGVTAGVTTILFIVPRDHGVLAITANSARNGSFRTVAGRCRLSRVWYSIWWGHRGGAIPIRNGRQRMHPVLANGAISHHPTGRGRDRVPQFR